MIELNEIELKEVKSSNIARIGYDAESSTLVVEFKGSGKYAYAGVPEKEYLELLEAKSVGQHFHAKIRSNPLYKALRLLLPQLLLISLAWMHRWP
jgi:hypothetical protein